MQRRECMLKEILTLKNIAIYFAIINLIGFLAMWIDKKKAKRGSWRISEKALFYITLLRRRNWNNSWNVYI